MKKTTVCIENNTIFSILETEADKTRKYRGVLKGNEKDTKSSIELNLARMKAHFNKLAR